MFCSTCSTGRLPAGGWSARPFSLPRLHDALMGLMGLPGSCQLEPTVLLSFSSSAVRSIDLPVYLVSHCEARVL